VQPAVKCRGREYLRIIYGPEYDARRTSSACARGLAPSARWRCASSRWGVEALERFVRAREPLRRVHECVFGVLALESEPVDPRL
jgi:protein phosphatase